MISYRPSDQHTSGVGNDIVHGLSGGSLTGLFLGGSSGDVGIDICLSVPT